MPRKPRSKSQSGVYHIMLRGANRQEIFHDDWDCMRFLETIAKYKVDSDMKMLAWCLMNNHVHLVVKEGREDISITMKRIGVSYVAYYNQKYDTIGHLFQDRFRSEQVETVRYLLTVVRYIHQNPLKAGMVKEVNQWKWSSCAGYYGGPTFSKGFLEVDCVLQYFSDNLSVARRRFREFNELTNEDRCLEGNKRLTDEEAREKMKKILGVMEIANMKGLPKARRDDALRQVKLINGISQRQVARILGISPNLVYKA